MFVTGPPARNCEKSLGYTRTERIEMDLSDVPSSAMVFWFGVIQLPRANRMIPEVFNALCRYAYAPAIPAEVVSVVPHTSEIVPTCSSLGKFRYMLSWKVTRDAWR